MDRELSTTLRPQALGASKTSAGSFSDVLEGDDFRAWESLAMKVEHEGYRGEQTEGVA